MDEDYREFFFAHGDIAKVKALVQRKPEFVHYRDEFGRSLLMLTADLKIAEFLLKNGIDVNHRDDEGGTIFLHYSPYQNIQLASLYLRHGANPCLKDNQGDTVESFCYWYWEYEKDIARKQCDWIQSVPVLVTLLAINERRKVGGYTFLQTELFRYLQTFLADKP